MPPPETLAQREALRQAKYELLKTLARQGIQAGVAVGTTSRGEGLNIIFEGAPPRLHLEECKALRDFAGFPVETRINEVRGAARRIA
ncbi:MAG: hypothetical protein K1X83_01250 [Oligoflexia bacterium]|nr:hypothetical protein [Oligoflexia bacterium]